MAYDEFFNQVEKKQGFLNTLMQFELFLWVLEIPFLNVGNYFRNFMYEKICNKKGSSVGLNPVHKFGIF